MERKSDMVRRLVAGGEYKKALAIAKGFRLGITLEERSTMTRAYECIVHPSFYRQIGTDIDRAIASGIDVLTRIYG